MAIRARINRQKAGLRQRGIKECHLRLNKARDAGSDLQQRGFAISAVRSLHIKIIKLERNASAKPAIIKRRCEMRPCLKANARNATSIQLKKIAAPVKPA